MFERFTDRARRVMVLAQEEARLLNHNFIGTEHLLLGLIHEHDGVAAKALASLGVTLDGVRDKVEEIIGPAGADTTGSPPFTPRAKKVLELSLREALQLGHNWIGTEHQLLGLVREGEGVGANILVASGVELSAVRNRVLDLLNGGEVDTVGAADSARVEPGAPAPHCANCRSALAEWARYVILEVQPGDEAAGLNPLPVTFVYCSRCGRALDRH
jgi:ATP-dependent Clp protease ATP-binding subunit ClpC